MERNTKQCNAVLGALVASRRALTPPEICSLAQEDVPRLNLSTVYRRLKDLQGSGAVLRVDLPGQPARYEAVAATTHGRRRLTGHVSDHHHHFHCNSCDQVFPIHACPGPMKQLAPKGFRVEGHEITLHGRCPGCGPAIAAR